MAYEHRLRVRYGETDQMGVVHHANYLLYMEEARTMYMATLGCPYSQVEASGIGLPVRDVDIRYRASATYEDELSVEVWISRLRSASVEFSYELRRTTDGLHIASATIVLACVRLSGPRKPTVLPRDLRTVLDRAQRPKPSEGA
jgi:acyl-CoA thioester hydrolase